MRRIVLPALAVAAILGSACARDAARAPTWAALREVTPAFLAERGARQAALAADAHGRVALTFVTRDSTGATDLWLSVSTDTGITFGEPVRVNERVGAVMSFAEARPLAAFGDDGRLAIIWTQRHGEEFRNGHSMAADVMVRSSADGGATLGPIAQVNDDAGARHPRYHGFATLDWVSGIDPGDSREFFAAWMDERDNPRVEGEASSAALYGAVSHDGGQHWERNVRITDRLCPCCRAAIAAGAGMVAILYRSAAHDLRDPALVVSADGGRTFVRDTILSADGWKIEACPVEGPGLTAEGYGGGMAAWYTEAGGPTIYIAPWSAAHGLGGVKRAITDSFASAAHPRIARWPNSTLIAVEAEPAGDTTRTVLAVRALDSGGTLTPWMFLGADVKDGWIASLGGRAALASWSEKESDGTRVRVTRIERR